MRLIRLFAAIACILLVQLPTAHVLGVVAGFGAVCAAPPVAAGGRVTAAVPPGYSRNVCPG